MVYKYCLRRKVPSQINSFWNNNQDFLFKILKLISLHWKNFDIYILCDIFGSRVIVYQVSSTITQIPSQITN